MSKRICLTFLGIAIISSGIAWMRFSGFGTDPFVTMNLGISHGLSINFGTVLMVANLILLVAMFFISPKLIHLGTALGIFAVGYLSDFQLSIISHLPGTLIVRIVAMIIGLLCCTFGVALYMTADLGLSPYDALGKMIEKKLDGKLKYKELRVITDVCCVTIGFILGAKIGLGTLITAFFTGPLNHYFLIRIDRFLNSRQKASIVG